MFVNACETAVAYNQASTGTSGINREIQIMCNYYVLRLDNYMPYNSSPKVPTSCQA